MSARRPTRVALVSERKLVGETIAAALRSRMIIPLVQPWPRRHSGARMTSERVAAAGVDLGLALTELETPDRLYDVELFIGGGPVQWVVLTDSLPDARWGAVLEAGALAVLPTPRSIDELAQIINDAVAGHSPMAAEERERLIGQWQEVSAEQRALVRRMERLTPRETQILSLLYEGLPVRRIAELSHVAEATVRSQVKAVRGKLGVDSQLAAVAMYRRALEVLPRRQRHG